MNADEVMETTGYSLRGKVIVVTGASGGMGRAHVETCTNLGARVLMVDLAPPDDGWTMPDSARFVEGSVDSEDDWLRIAQIVDRDFGRLDGLVNNAGILRPRRLAETPTTDFDQVVAVNQKGVFLGMRTLLPLFEKSGGGSIVNISSTAGVVGIAECFAYSATKFAVRGMTKAAAIELAGQGIRVNSVHPGDTLTPMIAGLSDSDAVTAPSSVPMGRFATPPEIARVVAFLLSDASSYMTGAELLVDGGYSAA